jgi:hypothetical protein
MTLVVKDRVQETSTTSGTGTLTLNGAITSFQSFSSIGNGNTTYYTITDGLNWEVGIGTYTLSGTTLSRDTVLSSSNSNSLVNFGTDTKLVSCTWPAEAGSTANSITNTTFTATAGQTEFLVDYTVGTNSLSVYVNGSKQIVGTNYVETDATKITFTTGLNLGDKVDCIVFEAVIGLGGVTGVSGTSPIVSSGGTTPAISIPAASSSTNGYLVSTDWTTFNSKYAVGGALGTPSSGVATNLTGTASGLTAGNVTTNANLTGVITSVGNATSIASQTGTGTKFVVDTSPTLVTPTATTTIGVGAATPSASGAGITFPATQSASTNANTLDDYEEGTWTIGISFGGASVGITASTTGGTYTKIGNVVNVRGYYIMTNKGSSVGSARITGLPFTSGAASANYSAVTFGLVGNITFSGQLFSYVNIGDTTCDLRNTTLLGVDSAITNTNFANNSTFIISATYSV